MLTWEFRESSIVRNDILFNLPEVVSDFGFIFVDNDSRRGQTNEILNVPLTLKNAIIITLMVHNYIHVLL